MSEYNMTHTGQELDAAIAKVQNGYILPSGTKNITTNGTHDVKNAKTANVNVPVPNQYYEESYTPSGLSLVKSRTVNCGFRPKIILITLHTDTTVSTVNGMTYALRINLDGLTSSGTGLYRLTTTNRFGAFGGGLSSSSFTDTGFTYNHATIGFLPGVTYNIKVWGIT